MMDESPQFRSIIAKCAEEIEQEKLDLETLARKTLKENDLLKAQLKTVNENILYPCIAKLEGAPLLSRERAADAVTFIKELIKNNFPGIEVHCDEIRGVKEEILALEKQINRYLDADSNYSWQLRDLQAMEQKNETELTEAIDGYQEHDKQKTQMRNRLADLVSERNFLNEQNEFTGGELKKIKDHGQYLANECEQLSGELETKNRELTEMQDEIRKLEEHYSARSKELSETAESCETQKTQIDSLVQELERNTPLPEENKVTGLRSKLDAIDYSIFNRMKWLEHTQLVMDRIRMQMRFKGRQANG